VSSTARQPVADETPTPTAATLAPAHRRPAVVPDLVRRFADWWETPAALDLAICMVFVSISFWLTRGLWPDPTIRVIADNPNDQALIEWFLSHGVLVWTGDFSFVTDRLNSPDGVNLMANASHILHGVIMAPITALFGAPVSFALLVALNLSATAAGWYLLLARGLRLNRAGAVVAGLVAGFAPGMISQSNSHLHMTAQWLVPPIVWCVIRLTRVRTTRATAATGLALGALIGGQLLLGEEVLFLTALTLLLFSIVYVVRRPLWTRQVAPRFIAGAAIAAGFAFLLVAYPVSVQLYGAQHLNNAPFPPDYYFADVASYGVFSPLSIGGSPEAGQLSTSSAEYNTYLGLPVLLLCLALALWRWRSPVTPALSVTGIVMALLSFGPYITVNRHRTEWPGLYRMIQHVPIINGALPSRYALALIPLVGVFLAYAIDGASRRGGFLRVAVPIAVAAAILPAAPIPLGTTSRNPVPTFITSGAWRQCAPDGGVIVPVPLPGPEDPDLMRWPAAANAAFGIPQGFFIAPTGANGSAALGVWPRPTSQLLAEVARSGAVPAVDDGMKVQAQADLNYWKADCVALAHVNAEAPLRMTLEALLGPGTPINGTWTWKVSR
jgi:hypothetical protein